MVGSSFESEIKALAIKGIGWLIAKRVVTQLLLTGTNLVLVRLLFPSDFGTFAIISFIITLSWSFADLGLGRALIQRRQEPDPVLLRSVWWTQVGLGVGVTGIIWFAAPLIISYYKGQLDLQAIGWLRILAISQILSNMAGVSGSLLERRLAYDRILVIETGGLFTTQISTILFAWLGLGVTSFVFGNILGRVMTLILFFVLSPWKWGLTWVWGRLKGVFSFGVPLQMSSWIGILNGAVVPVFVGRFPGPGGWSGSQAVGFVTWAGGVAAFSGVFAGIIDQILFPIMSRLQKDLALAERFFRRALRIVSITTLGVVSLLLPLAPEVTRIIYTPHWLPALPALRLATLQIVFLVVSGLAINALLAFGEAKFYRNLQALWAALQWLLTVPLVALLGFWGVNLAGVLVSATALFAFVRLRKYFKINFFKTLSIPLFCSVTTGALVYGISHRYQIDSLVRLVVVISLGSLIYFILIYLFLRQDLRPEFKIVKEFSGRLFVEKKLK